MPTLNYKVNFIFLRDPVYATHFSNCTQAQLINDANLTLADINSKFQACGNIPSLLTPPNPSPLVANPKINLILNNVYTPTTPMAISDTEFDQGNIYNAYNYDGATTFNIYFMTGVTQYVIGRAFPGQFTRVHMVNAPTNVSPQHVPGTTVEGDLLWHELCHGLGFLGDHYGGTATYNPLSYIPDDAAIDVQANYDCSIPSTQPNNNVMGNSGCRQHLSAKQIANFHYLVAMGYTKKFTQFNTSNYPYYPPSIAPNSINLTGVQNLSQLAPFTLLTIKTGADITLNNISMALSPNAKVVVEPGARLTLNCVYFTALGYAVSNATRWAGIEVWGNAALTQDMQSSGMSFNQGVLVVNDSRLEYANRAILAGKRSGSGSFLFDYTATGGIVIANRTTFKDNYHDINLHPLTYGLGGISAANPNLSTITECKFTRSLHFMNAWNGASFGPHIMVNLEGVKEVKFNANQFSLTNSRVTADTSICIKGFNSSIIAGDGTSLSLNQFDSAFYAIYMVGGPKSTIDYNWFFTRNGVCINRSNYNKITRNLFQLNNVANGLHTNSLRTGIYMNECTNYKIEGNSISGVNSSVPAPNGITEGICINNSGPVATQIYRNGLSSLTQGIWCQNQNYDPNSPTGDGLRINCNNFNICNYNIGVQSPLVMLNAIYPPARWLFNNWQSNFSQAVYNCGIAPTQGISGGLNQYNVRNTYRNVPASGNENKFYSFTSYCNPPQITHGNFQEASPAKFGVGPQPAYSDGYDVVDLYGNTPAPALASSYCPDNSALPASANRAALRVERNTHTQNINTWYSSYIGRLDGGNTQALLNSIGNVNQLNTVTLKNTLVQKDFLSDTVMIRYFTPSTVPAAYVQEVFVKNAPVQRRVWQAILNRNLPAATMTILNAKQKEAKLSTRAAVLGPIAIAKNDRSASIMHLSMAFLNDRTLTNYKAKDSIAALITLNSQGDVAKQLIELDFAFADYNAATTKLSSYTHRILTQKNKYVAFKTLLIKVLRAPGQLHSLEVNAADRAAVAAAARDWNHPCMQEARDILFGIFNTFYPEQKLMANSASSARMMQTEETSVTTLPESGLQALAQGISCYPNPAGNEVFINNQTEQEYQLTITSVNGQVLLQNQIKANDATKVDTGNLPNGIYFVNLYQGKLFVKTQKLIIAK